MVNLISVEVISVGTAKGEGERNPRALAMQLRAREKGFAMTVTRPFTTELAAKWAPLIGKTMMLTLSECDESHDDIHLAAPLTIPLGSFATKPR